ncbi:hypothetical protein IKE98_01105 [Candidatus Saccharibacteria bacterium]|nr:hypothetical protein [Candidatus Saccharibacteria bacterium]
MKKKLEKVVLLIALFIGFLIISAPKVKAAPNPIDASKDKRLYARFGVETPLRSGNMDQALLLDLLPLYENLAKGQVPGDKYTWSYESSPFYVEQPIEGLAEQMVKNFAFVYINEVRYSATLIRGESIGLYDLKRLNYDSETREVMGANGEKTYRCAITGISVKEWCTPEGSVCSRQKALNLYGQCQKRIKALASKAIAAHRSNGKPLTTTQRIKAIRDWLVENVEYDLKAYYALGKGQSSKYVDSFNEYGPIMKGKAVCQGYAYAFKAIVDELVRQTHVKAVCEYVFVPESSKGDGHGWNRIKLNGQWYHVDVTADDDGGGLGHGKLDTIYFLISDRTLSTYLHPGRDGYYTYNVEKATGRRYEGKNWPIYRLEKIRINGTAKATKKYKLGKRKAIRPFDKSFKPSASVYRYTKIFTHIKISKELILRKGVDYIVRYKNNRKRGWATAIIKLKGGFSGTITIKYKIV